MGKDGGCQLQGINKFMIVWFSDSYTKVRKAWLHGVISCSIHIPRGMINISLSSFSVSLPCFLHFNSWPSCFALAPINWSGKDAVRNLQNGPRILYFTLLWGFLWTDQSKGERWLVSKTYLFFIERFTNDCRTNQNQSNYSDQSQQEQTARWTNHISYQLTVPRSKRGQNPRAFQSWASRSSLSPRCK